MSLPSPLTFFLSTHHKVPLIIPSMNPEEGWLGKLHAAEIKSGAFSATAIVDVY